LGGYPKNIGGKGGPGLKGARIMGAYGHAGG